jgi:hypothetical protein
MESLVLLLALLGAVCSRFADRALRRTLDIADSTSKRRHAVK